MSYTIAARIIQNDPAKWFSIVERTVFYKAGGGSWTQCDGEQILSLGGSGTSGTLRFKNFKDPEGEYFLVALGVHDNKRWCDIEPDLSAENTGLAEHPLYYDTNYNQSRVPPKQSSEAVKKTKKGATITVKYYKEDGHNLYATITINY